MPVDNEVTPVDSEPMLDDVAVERLINDELNPVDNEPMLVELDMDSDVMPVEVDVERLPTVLFVVLRPVDSELIANVTDDDSEDS